MVYRPGAQTAGLIGPAQCWELRATASETETTGGSSCQRPSAIPKLLPMRLPSDLGKKMAIWHTRPERLQAVSIGVTKEQTELWPPKT